MDEELVMSQELFEMRLRQRKPNHDAYAENGKMLMSKLEALEVPKDARGHVSGFVTPNVDALLRKEVLAFSAKNGWTTAFKGGLCKPKGGGPPFARYTLVIIRA